MSVLRFVKVFIFELMTGMGQTDWDITMLLRGKAT